MESKPIGMIDEKYYDGEPVVYTKINEIFGVDESSVEEDMIRNRGKHELFYQSIAEMWNARVSILELATSERNSSKEPDGRTRLRLGQCVFNVITKNFPVLGEELRASNIDPFYMDSNIEKALDYVQKNMDNAVKDLLEKKPKFMDVKNEEKSNEIKTEDNESTNERESQISQDYSSQDSQE